MQVKLELEVTLTPEAEVSSTVANNNSNNSSDSDHSNETPLISTINTPTVIPPTTIVCLPTMVSVPNSGTQKVNNIQATYINAPSLIAQKQQQQQQLQTQLIQSQQQAFGKTMQRTQQIQLPQSTHITQGPINQRAAIVASSSSLPYLQLQTTQPLRAVQQTANATTINLKQQQLQQQLKIQNKGGRGSRTHNNNRPPPGAVNLERSYQICQAVIQNSPNRHHLKAQLRPPPSLLTASNNTNANNSVVAPVTIKKEDITISATRTTYKVNLII